MSEPVSTARYFPWNGGAVFVGRAGAFPAHAHQAIQICFLFDGRIRLRPTDADAWTDYDVAIVPSRHSHGMDGAKVHYGATIFVEPETREGRILTERYLQNGIAGIERAASSPGTEAPARRRRGTEREHRSCEKTPASPAEPRSVRGSLSRSTMTPALSSRLDTPPPRASR